MLVERWIYPFILNSMVIAALGVLIPLYIVYLGGGAYEVGVAITIINVSSIPSLVLWSKASDYLGRRKAFIVLGLASTFSVTLLYSIAKSIWEVYLVSALQGALTSSYIPTSSMLIIETRQKEFWNKGIAVYQIACGVGHMAGLLLGATFKLLLPYRETLILLSFFSLASTITSIALIPESGITLEREPVITKLSRVYLIERVKVFWFTLINPPKWLDAKIFKNLRVDLTRGFPLFLIGTLLVFTGISVFFTPIPVLLKNSGLSDSLILAMYSIPTASSIISYSFFSRGRGEEYLFNLLLSALTARITLFTLFTLTYYALFVFNPGVLGKFLIYSTLFALIGVTWSALSLSTNTLVAELTTHEQRGSAYGYFNAFIGLGMIAGSYVGGFIADFVGYHASTATSVIFLVVGLTLFKSLKSTHT